MKASYNKIQEYFSKKLPEPRKLAELLTYHSYEVENIEEIDGDYIFNIDILPNRAGDSSSDGGVARELSAILNTSLKKNPFSGKLSESKISISVSGINKFLGSNISQEEAENIFKKLGFNYEINGEDFIVNPPLERMDIKIKADLMEEVGRIYGYENIEAKLPKKTEKAIKINKKLYYTNKIKQFLADKGYSEVYTYSFRNKGEVEIKKPFASDKNFLRIDLRDGLKKALEQNVKNLPLLDTDIIKIFEIGNVFKEDEEYTSFAIGWSDKNEDIVDRLSEFLGIDVVGEMKDKIFETNFNILLEKLSEPKDNYEELNKKTNIVFKPISQYPFILRDIAIWVPTDVKNELLLEVIEKEANLVTGLPSYNINRTIEKEAEGLLVNIKLFDKFKKDGKISYAFNLVFQSYNKTLSDKEVNKIMDKITVALNNNLKWEVR